MSWEHSGVDADGAPLERRLIEWEVEDGPWIPLGTVVVPEGCIPGVVRLELRRIWRRPRYEVRKARCPACRFLCCLFFWFRPPPREAAVGRRPPGNPVGYEHGRWRVHAAECRLC